MRAKTLPLVLISTLLLGATALSRRKGEIRFVETDVDLRRDGAAVVGYTVQWAVLSGELHGFYFEGNDRLRVRRFSSDSYAVDSRGQRYGLERHAGLRRHVGHRARRRPGRLLGHGDLPVPVRRPIRRGGLRRPDHRRGRAGTGRLQLVAGAVGRGGPAGSLHAEGAHPPRAARRRRPAAVRRAPSSSCSPSRGSTRSSRSTTSAARTTACAWSSIGTSRATVSTCAPSSTCRRAGSPLRPARERAGRAARRRDAAGR